MKSVFLVSVLIMVVNVMAMPQKMSLTPLSSDEEFGSARGNALQNLGSVHDRYQMFVLAPVRNEDRSRHSLDSLRVSPELQMPSDASKIKKNFDEIDKASASFSTLNQLI